MAITSRVVTSRLSIVVPNKGVPNEYQTLLYSLLQVCRANDAHFYIVPCLKYQGEPRNESSVSRSRVGKFLKQSKGAVNKFVFFYILLLIPNGGVIFLNFFKSV